MVVFVSLDFKRKNPIYFFRPYLDPKILHQKTPHGMFGYMHGVLNKIYLQIFFVRMGCKSRDESNEPT